LCFQISWEVSHEEFSCNRGCGATARPNRLQRIGNGKIALNRGDTSAALRAAFNADAGKVRVLMVVSPTCGECLEGASEVSEQVAEINQGRTVPLYVMWVPRRGGREKDVPAATRVIADTSAHEFWDGNDLLGMQYKQVLGWSGNAWDVYMVYGPKANGAGTFPLSRISLCTRRPKKAPVWTLHYSEQR
jgi:hypothetical protein